MYQMMIDALHRRIFGRLGRRTKQMKEDFTRIKTALTDGQNEAVYDRLAEMARHSELLCMDLREALTAFHSDLQTTEFFPPLLPYPQAGEVEVALENGYISIKMAAMLPFPSNGSVFFLHDQLDRALRRFLLEHKLPTPIFTERCAVVFLHHYGPEKADIRHLRDYDNVEHRCVTNVLALHLLWGDSPKCIISMDVLAPGDHNYTEIRVMPLPTFRRFVMSEDIAFLP